MKTFLFSLFLIANLYPQWNDIPTSISESNLVYLENFANKDGIHIVIQASNSIKYYKINTEGF